MGNLTKLILIIPLAFLLSCSHKDQGSADTTSTRTISYTLEIDNNYRIYKIICIDEHNTRYAKVFEYTDKTVKELSEDGNLICTYYLNSAGLADSCGKTKFLYSPDGYLLTENYGATYRQHEYSGGNRIKTTWGTNKLYYQFNSMTNLLDIENFHGSFLGKLNRNLVSSVRIQFLKASNGTNTSYSYEMNNKGLVLKRTGITTYYDDNPDSRTVTTFSYVEHK